MMKYGLLASLMGVIVLSTALMFSMRSNQNKAIRIGALERSVAVLEDERDQAQEARRVADALRKATQARAEEYDALREAILRGEDDEIPDWMLNHLFDLGVVQRSTD